MTQGSSKVVTQKLHYDSHYSYDDVSFAGFGSPIYSHSEMGAGGLPATLTSSVAYGANWPDWLYRIRMRLNATTTLSGDIARVTRAQEGQYHAYWKMVPNSPSATNYEVREDNGHGYFGIYSPTFPSFNPLSISLSTADNRALARYNAKVAEVNRQFQGGVFLGELAEALHGIRHPAEALFKGIESYSNAATKLRRSFVKTKTDYLSLSKTRRRKVGKAFSDAATGLWLENSFHWVPLMYDIQGAISALTHTLDNAPTQFVKASAVDKQSETYSQTSYGGPRIYTGVTGTRDTVGAAVKYYGIVRVGPRAPGKPDLKALGFDLRSFVPTIWELIPYSWAVDYFSNIGDIIYGASYGGSDLLWTTRGTKKFASRYQTSGIMSQAPVPTSGWHFVTLYGTMKQSEVATEKAQIARAPFDGSFIPSLEFKVPGMSLKWLNLGAVFLQRSLAFL